MKSQYNFNTAQNIVIKIGSALLIDEDNNLRAEWLQSVADDIAQLKGKNINILVVSSGAVAIGRKYINQDNKNPLTIEQKQAAAACGQMTLVEAYRKSFAKHDISSAQILLSLVDSENRRRYINAKNTIETLLNNGVIPIVNENDTVATNELRFGDNDRLAARVAQMVGADTLILLSDIEGLYTSNPHTSNDAQHIDIVEDINKSIDNMANDIVSNVSSGGMKSKIQAAKIGVAHGCSTIITSGLKNNPISALFNGAKHTLFKSSTTPHNSRIAWIANILQPKGIINIDAGAAKAVRGGNSLLAAGIVSVSGDFSRGDVAVINDQNGKEIAKGLVAYCLDDIQKIAGKKSNEIANIVGYTGRNEVIHRNDMAIL